MIGGDIAVKRLDMVSTGCVICGTRITESNDSEEHIILNAIGGMRRTSGFICEKHNNTTGSDWDAELASQLNGLCHIFAVQRDRGDIPDEVVKTTNEETFVLLRDGGMALPKPTLEKKRVGAATHIQVKARDKREARKILVGLKKKYPNIDVDAEIAKANPSVAYPEGLIQILIQIGGARAGRSIVKSALAFAHDSGIPTDACEQALAYLRNENAQACFGYYQSSDLVVARPHGVPFHCVAINGNPETALLLGYVEYFGFLRIVVVLSEKFTGTAISRCYAIDPRSGKELELSVSMRFTHTDIGDIYDYKHCDHNDVARNLDDVLGPAMVRKNERESQHVRDEAIRYAFENCGAKEGEILTAEHVARIAQLVAERFTSYLVNLNRPRPSPPGTTFYPGKPNQTGLT